MLKRLGITFKEVQEKKPKSSKSQAVHTDTFSVNSTLHSQSESEEGALFYVPKNKKQTWDFTRFHGAAKKTMTMDEIDARLNELRQEWERDTL